MLWYWFNSYSIWSLLHTIELYLYFLFVFILIAHDLLIGNPWYRTFMFEHESEGKAFI